MTVRAIGREISHSSSANTGHTTNRMPLGNRSAGRLVIGENDSLSRGCIIYSEVGKQMSKFCSRHSECLERRGGHLWKFVAPMPRPACINNCCSVALRCVDRNTIREALRM